MVMTRFAERTMLYLSCLMWLFAIILLAIAAFTNTPNPLFITLAFMPFCIGQIVPTTLLYPHCINYLPNAKARISAIVQGGRLIFAAIGLQIASYFYTGSFQIIGAILIGVIGVATFMLLTVMRHYLKTNPTS